MDRFEYNSNPGRVVFGPGCIQNLPAEIRRLNLKSPLVLSTPEQGAQANELAVYLKDASLTPAGTFTGATMHTPFHTTNEALSFLLSHPADCIVSIGGGSTIGLGKAISIRTGLEHICIPTTYAGSEMTPIVGETRDGKKTSRSDSRLLPGTVIYDVNLTMTLPVALSVVSGLNAIAHAVEALYAKKKNPIVSLLALEGIKSLAESLPNIRRQPQSLSARQQAQYGAWLCGICLGTSSMALHHKLCHVLGGSFNLPHAETHSIVLPHTLSYNAPAIPDVVSKLATVLPGSDNGDAVRGLNTLLEELQVMRALKDVGMKEEDIDKAADIALRDQYPNPRRVEREPIRELIRRCWAGEPARADL